MKTATHSGNIEVVHVPKGSMCMVCVNLYANCSHLPFHTYQPIVRHKDGVVETKCKFFQKEDKC
ncbi:hypothetical protein D3C71_1984260 [compost metagenome]